MRVLYLTQWFEPEPNIIKGIRFVRALEAAGHDVTVVTGFPNYPAGRLYPGYRLRLVQHETIEGVRVIRLPLYPSHDASSLRRSLNFLSFFVPALIYCLFRAGRYDLAYVYHPPITVGLAAAMAGLVRRLPFVLDVQDLWPDTLAATGMVGAARLIGPIGALCRLIYRRSLGIIAQSEGMKRALVGRGVPAGKVMVIRNWAEAEFAAVRDRASGTGAVSFVYGGNLGRAQALETLIDAAAIARRRRRGIQVTLYGDGVDAEALQSRPGASAARFMGRVPAQQILPIFAAADALLLHLRDDPLFAITIPSKTQFYLAMGRPIVAGVAGEAADILRRSGAAIVVPPGDPDAFAQALIEMAALSAGQRDAMGAAGRDYYAANFSFEQAMRRTLTLIEGTKARAMSKRPART
ncbi:glycosyltransferase family 4 protein [Sphingomonas sp.]|jgi:glycosyltransferase involved in cell wall biosynthesis|uniref:glycosyltransferase family 4 protein n=1 Tax=Sphingomonas sp. TaxID=28214 RepID=UPI002E3218F5|nr:glycosyltransferase family 4 protein [Sphingomonas sp.]HEX4695444.1 glycosyltransferase family 4 protein [Sphingomonas sp.]